MPLLVTPSELALFCQCNEEDIRKALSRKKFRTLGEAQRYINNLGIRSRHKKEGC